MMSSMMALKRTKTEVKQHDEFGELKKIEYKDEKVPVAFLEGANCPPHDGPSFVCDQFEYVVITKPKETSSRMFEEFWVDFKKKYSMSLVSFGHSAVVLNNKTGPHSFEIIDDKQGGLNALDDSTYSFERIKQK